MRKRILLAVALIALTCGPKSQLVSTNNERNITTTPSAINSNAESAKEEIDSKALNDETIRYPDDFLGIFLQQLLTSN